MKQTSAYCPTCDRQVYATGQSPNHVLHLLLTIFTCGLWWVIWALIGAGSIGNYRCTRCGSRVESASGAVGRRRRRRRDDDEDDD